MWGFKAKVGNQPEDQVVGGYDLGMSNDRGDKPVTWAKSHNTITGIMWYQQHS